jgi:hypothetical protein
MEGESALKIDSSSVNTPVVVSMVCLYILFRNMTSKTPTINFIRGKFASITGMILTISIIASTIYNITLYFLSTKFQIDKISLELLQKFDKQYMITFQDYTFDLGSVLVTSLKVADVLLISSVFLCISVGVPNIKQSTLPTLHWTISFVSRAWAFFRMPLVYYSNRLEIFINEKLALFLMLVFLNIELIVASVFSLMLKFRNNDMKKSNMDIGFLSLCLFLYGFLKYSINFIDFPFQISNIVLGLIYSTQYVLSISLYLLVAGIIFPKNEIKVIVKEKIEPCQSMNLAILEEIIEFEDSKNQKLIN